MPQHSAKWPACPECRHHGVTDDAGNPCITCLDEADFIPAVDPVSIEARIARIVRRYLKVPFGQADSLTGLGLRSVDRVQVDLDIEDEWEIAVPLSHGADSVEALAGLVRGILAATPGEAGEVVNHAAWVEDTLAACAEGRIPPPVAETRAAACADGLRPRKADVVYGEIVHPPAKIREG